jgi:hypothetical protein
VAYVGAAAGAVETQRWQSASARSRNDARARSGNWPGGPAQSKLAWPQDGIKMELDRTEQWSGPVNLFQ